MKFSSESDLTAEYKSEAKLKEQSNSRLTDSKKPLAVNKGKRLGMMNWGRGRGVLRGIVISMQNIRRSRGMHSSKEKASPDPIASFSTLIDSDCYGVMGSGGDLIIWVSVENTMLLMWNLHKVVYQ